MCENLKVKLAILYFRTKIKNYHNHLSLNFLLARVFPKNFSEELLHILLIGVGPINEMGCGAPVALIFSSTVFSK